MKKLRTLGGFDDNLRPLSMAEVYRRAARRAAILQGMDATAKASEQTLPADERRQIIDMAELRTCLCEMVVACVIATPVACACILAQVL